MSNRNPDESGVLLRFGGRPEGLTGDEAREKIDVYGRNVLQEKKKKPPLLLVWEQVRDPMVLVLMAAAIISGILGELPDMIIILIVVVANTVIGLVQESKAEKAITALRKLSAQQARVMREGSMAVIPAEELVPGDIVMLEAGDLVPADLFLIESSALKIGEASLTGESVPAEKDASAQVAEDCALGDRVNMAFCGTGVTYGHGGGVVSATGMNTEMGHIAGMLNTAEEGGTPLQKKLAEIGKFITVAVVGICAVIFVTYVLKNGGFTLGNTLNAFMIAVSLAVAAIPEGLPAVVTIVMAVGVTRMARRRAIIKKLPAVETLGCAEIICTDKTGTLTQNKMDVREVYVSGHLLPGAEFLSGGQGELFADILYLCNDSTVGGGSEIGDPTETALKRFVLQRYDAARFAAMRRMRDLPFDSERKMMTTVNETPDGLRVFTKGAPDELLKSCTHILLEDGVAALTDDRRRIVLSANRVMAEKALRVLGAAYKPWAEAQKGGIPEDAAPDDPQREIHALESGLVFVGLVGMIDPPRPEVYEAIEKCRHAGITPIMITGDHKDTAVAIAREVGIINDPAQAVFGSELDALNDDELDTRLTRYHVYA
ncbi:MAG: HAD-IC family P-type ATPase, partial [Clostridia bacterium]|nr:HAD-IC family P-type ATPase [Clostridia bacterium]